MKPIRVQRERIKGWEMPPDTVYVGRPTKWGNPFTVEYSKRLKWWIVPDDEFGAVTFETKEEASRYATDKYKEYIKRKIDSGDLDIIELKGKDLACWCPLLNEYGYRFPCHADVLLELANKE